MTIEASTLEKLKQSFQKLLPLVDELADGLGMLLLLSFALTVWIFVYLYHLQQLSLLISLGVSSVVLIPILSLSRIWFALENLKNIPTIAEEMIEEVTDEVAQSWHAVKSGKKSALNIFAQAKKLLEIRSILSSTGDIIEQYFNIAVLLNPFYLFFGIFSLICLFFLFIAGLFLGGLAIV